MGKNTDLIVVAVLLALVLVLGAALEVLSKPVPGLLGTAGTVLLGAVGALARSASGSGDTSSSDTSNVIELPAAATTLEGPR